MGSHNEVEVVTVEEFMDDIYAECEWYTAIVFIPSLR